MKIVFSYINEETKLKLIKYNKSLQNELKINIVNYRRYSGKYLIKIDNRRVKVYKSFNYKLLYKGEYLNGKKHGKGKEYYHHSTLLKFTGEYLNGKKWDGIGYDDTHNSIYKLNYGKGHVKKIFNHKIKFEGEYSNGKKNGKGMECNFFTELSFEGEFRNGKKWNGKLFDRDNNISYEMKNGKGYIKKYIPNNLIFEGEYLNGELYGKGKIIKDFSTFMNKYIYIYEGGFFNGKKHGKGKEYKNNELIFEGEFIKDERNGKGKEYFKNKLRFDGEYLNNKKWSGKGYDENGNIIYEINNGKGMIKEFNDEGRLISESEYLDGKKTEKVKNIIFTEN